MLSVEFLGVVSAAENNDIRLSGDTDYLNNGIATIEDGDKSYSIKHHAEGIAVNGDIVAIDTVTFTPGDGEIEYVNNRIEPLFTYENGLKDENKIGGHIHTVYTLYSTDGTALVRKGNDANIWIDNLFHSFWFYTGEYNAQTNGRYLRGAETWRACIIYVDGSAEYIDFDLTVDTSRVNIAATIENASKDIKCIEFHLYTGSVERAYTTYYLYQWDCDYYLGEAGGDDTGTVGVDIIDQTTGLLATLLDWVKSIRQGVTEIFDTLSSGFGAVVNGITSLPRLIWEKIETGLKNLFVPDEEYISDYMVDMDALLDEKFGAVYQVIDVTLESWDRISANDEQNTIDFPETTIALPDDNEFTFGGYEVPIVPEGFEWLATALKGFVGVVCTAMFVNGLRKRYDEVMGGGA